MTTNTEEDNFLDSLNKDLALALGDAIWAFARIEWLTYESLNRLSRDHLGDIVGDLNFRPRAAIIRRIVERGELSPEKKARAIAALHDNRGQTTVF